MQSLPSPLSPPHPTQGPVIPDTRCCLGPGKLFFLNRVKPIGPSVTNSNPRPADSFPDAPRAFMVLCISPTPHHTHSCNSTCTRGTLMGTSARTHQDRDHLGFCHFNHFTGLAHGLLQRQHSTYCGMEAVSTLSCSFPSPPKPLLIKELFCVTLL